MPYRIIFSLFLDLGRDADGSFVGLVVPLDRRGDGEHLRMRRYKRRAIDLRAGDRVLCLGRWRRIERIWAYRDCWLDKEQVGRRRTAEGYLYRAG